MLEGKVVAIFFKYLPLYLQNTLQSIGKRLN